MAIGPAQYDQTLKTLGDYQKVSRAKVNAYYEAINAGVPQAEAEKLGPTAADSARGYLADELLRDNRLDRADIEHLGHVLQSADYQPGGEFVGVRKEVETLKKDLEAMTKEKWYAPKENGWALDKTYGAGAKINGCCNHTRRLTSDAQVWKDPDVQKRMTLQKGSLNDAQLKELKAGLAAKASAIEPRHEVSGEPSDAQLGYLLGRFQQKSGQPVTFAPSPATLDALKQLPAKG